MKRCFDIVVSGVALLFLFPVLVMIAVAVRLDSFGPAFYKGIRVGRNDELFRIAKFRTMIVNAERLGGPSTASNDPRITRLGKFLRKHKLDELPQLINVFKGEMSLVGPRPEVPSEVLTYSAKERELLSVRPGITDWASLQFRDEGQILKGSSDPHQAYRDNIRPEKVRLGLQYIHQHSFATDLKILVDTAIVLILAGIRGRTAD